MGGTVSTMFSTRFQRPVLISNHARIRIAERDISEAMLLDVIDSGEARYQRRDSLVGIQRFSGTA